MPGILNGNSLIEVLTKWADDTLHQDLLEYCVTVYQLLNMIILHFHIFFLEKKENGKSP